MLSKLSTRCMTPAISRSKLALAIAATLPLLAPVTQAAEHSLDNGLTVEWDLDLSYGAMYRLKGQSPDLLDDSTRDNGNRNFDKGIVSSRTSFFAEMDISGEDSGIFLRANGFYDSEVKDLNLADDVDEIHGSDVKLLDAFYYANFDWGNIRIGNQVVSWGEGLFLPSLSALQSPIDLTKFNVPGVQLKEIFLPEEQVYTQIYLTDSLALEAYYQWDWNKHNFDGVGTYFSDFDYFGPGTDASSLGMNFAGYNDAKDSGQHGLALRYVAEKLNDTEFGFYYLNYHDRVGIQIFNGPNLSYAYKEDNKAYGVSVSTSLGDTNVSGELFYRPNAPVYPSSFDHVAEADIWQANLSWIHVFGPNAIADDMDFAGEISHQYVEGNDHSTKGGTLGYGTQNSTAIAAELALYYKNVLPKVNLRVPVGFVSNFNGTAADQMVTFDEDTHSWYVGVNGNYGDNWSFSAKYTDFFGEGNDKHRAPTEGDFGPTPSLGDRDFISMNVSYSF